MLKHDAYYWLRNRKTYALEIGHVNLVNATTVILKVSNLSNGYSNYLSSSLDLIEKDWIILEEIKKPVDDRKNTYLVKYISYDKEDGHQCISFNTVTSSIDNLNETILTFQELIHPEMYYEERDYIVKVLTEESFYSMKG